MKVSDVMTRNPACARSDDSVKKAAEIMKEINVGAVPVLEGDTAVGILTDRDITVRLIAEGRDPQQTRIGDIMSSNPVACDENTDVQDALQLMSDKQLRRVLVKDSQDKVTGVVSLGDLAVKLGKKPSGDALKDISEPARPER